MFAFFPYSLLAPPHQDPGPFLTGATASLVAPISTVIPAVAFLSLWDALPIAAFEVPSWAF